jgi:DNA-binding NarL/FixJ family response regulator
MNGRGARNARVWLVDDNARFRSLLASLLIEGGGFDCEREFSNPADALAALAEGNAPDIILLDIEMGEYNGLDAIRPLKSAAKDTHVLMLTTFAAPEARTRAFREGASDFMFKSWSPTEIAAHMRQAMEFESVAGLMTAFLNGGGSVAGRSPAPKVAMVVPRETVAERWMAYLRGLLKLSPS